MYLRRNVDDDLIPSMVAHIKGYYDGVEKVETYLDLSCNGIGYIYPMIQTKDPSGTDPYIIGKSIQISQTKGVY